MKGATQRHATPRRKIIVFRNAANTAAATEKFHRGILKFVILREKQHKTGKSEDEKKNEKNKHPKAI